MFVRTIQQFADLTPYRQQWEVLAHDCVFRSFDWLSTWWRHYGQEFAVCSASRSQQKLRVLLVIDDQPSAGETLRGILPCYSQRALTQGQVWHLLGDGEVCSEHLDLLVEDEHRQQVVSALADHFSSCKTDWDSLQFTTVAGDREALSMLVDQLQQRGCTVDSQQGANLWSIDLPATWEEFLAAQSKSHRKQLRRLESRVLNSTRTRWHLVKNEDEFHICWEILRDLHQRRRISLGEPGCFASERWANFHREVALQMLANGNLRLSWLELDGEPVAAEYNFAGTNITSAYQGGLDPDRCDDEPGRLSMIRTIQHAIAEGHSNFDLLRGDEPYKPHWRAVPTPTRDIQVISPRARARWRHRTYRGLRRMGRTVKQITSMLS